MEKKYKFITIKRINDELFERQPVYRVFNKKSKEQLGIISYYKPWKKYVFSSKEFVVFDVDCLKCVIDFIEHINSLIIKYETKGVVDDSKKSKKETKI